MSSNIEINEKESVSNKRPMRTAFIRVSAENHITKDNEKLGLKEGDVVKYTLEEILAIIDEWQRTKKFDYFIIEHNEKEENKHFHIVISFPKNSSCKFSTLKNKFPYGHIDSCRTGVKHCVRYLCHADNPEKAQYPWDNIITNVPSKLEVYKISSKTNCDVETQKIIDNILKGEIKKFEIDKIDPEIYIKKSGLINAAFEYRQQSLLTKPNRDVKIIVLQGETRAGKSTFCRAWAEKQEKSIFFSSASKDFFGEYLGQEIAVLDDFDYTTVKIHDFKKIIDPYVSTAIGSRYQNKLFIGDTIFIATNQDITTWFPRDIEIDRKAIFERINFVLIFNDRPSADGIVSYTVNKFVDMELKPIENPNRTFDLGKYISITAKEEKNEDFLKKLDEM